MDEVDNCVSLPARVSFFIGDSAIPRMVKPSTPAAQQLSDLLFDVPSSQGQRLPPISSLLKMKPKSGGMQLRSRALSPAPSYSSDCDIPTDMLKSCEILDNSLTEDPGRFPAVPSVKIDSSKFYSKKPINSAKTSPPRSRAPVLRRCKSSDLRKIMQSCASILLDGSFNTASENAVPTKDEIRSENIATDDNASPIDDDSGSQSVKTDMVTVFMKKAEQSKTWAYVTDVEQKLKAMKDSQSSPKTDDKDPNAGLMSMMKKMYDEGDDDMKRTINKAWCESQEKRNAGQQDFDMPPM